MHDCNPRNFGLQDGEWDRKRAWTGDTWKAAVTLRLIPDIEIVIVDIDQGV
eukprot:gene27479-34200_t